MIKEDEDFYKDNCSGSYIAVCTTTIPKAWLKSKKRKNSREESVKSKMAATESKLFEQKRLDEAEKRESLECSMESDLQQCLSEPQISEEFLKSDSKFCYSKDERNPLETKDQQVAFRQIKIRTGRKTFNESLMRCIVQCLAETRMSPDEVSRVIIQVANMVFGQN